MFERTATVIDRRAVMVGSAALLLSGWSAPARATSNATPVAALQAIERRGNGRLGAYVLDTATGTGFGWREKKRFAHCSSFKMSLAAMILAQADKGDIDLDENLRWTREDMLPVSPVTQANLDKGLSVRELAKATLITSDNTAANVLLRRFGGPATANPFLARARRQCQQARSLGTGTQRNADRDRTRHHDPGRHGGDYREAGSRRCPYTRESGAAEILDDRGQDRPGSHPCRVSC